MSGPKSDPPIPIFTISVIDLPEYPFHLPEITLLLKLLIFLKAVCICGFIFFPSIRIGSSELLLKAVCKTSLPSVTLITAPAYCFSIASFKSTSFANSTSSAIVSLVILFFEKSTDKSPNSKEKSAVLFLSLHKSLMLMFLFSLK